MATIIFVFVQRKSPKRVITFSEINDYRVNLVSL